jgi:hypothetical protein
LQLIRLAIGQLHLRLSVAKIGSNARPRETIGQHQEYHLVPHIVVNKYETIIRPQRERHIGEVIDIEEVLVALLSCGTTLLN